MSLKETLADVYKAAMDSIHDSVHLDKESQRKMLGDTPENINARLHGYDDAEQEFFAKKAPGREERVRRGLNPAGPQKDPAKEAATKMELKPRYTPEGGGIIRKDQ